MVLKRLAVLNRLFNMRKEEERNEIVLYSVDGEKGSQPQIDQRLIPYAVALALRYGEYCYSNMMWCNKLDLDNMFVSTNVFVTKGLTSKVVWGDSLCIVDSSRVYRDVMHVIKCSTYMRKPLMFFIKIKKDTDKIVVDQNDYERLVSTLVKICPGFRELRFIDGFDRANYFLDYHSVARGDFVALCPSKNMIYVGDRYIIGLMECGYSGF